MIMWCRHKPNQKVKIACNSREQVSQMADILHTKLEQGERLLWSDGTVKFANGSKIECSVGGNGLAIESMWIDETISN